MADLTRLGRYELRQILGKGAMGVVYDGFDPTINRRVAVKIILKSHAIDEDMARAYSARFVREAQAAGRINHPNIVQVYDFGEQEDITYLVMEFIQGRDLRSFFSAKEPFDIKESVRIMVELLDALDFAHGVGVIHRDVKPANVMLDGRHRVKLADFGVARIQDSERSAADTMVGTPAYMSPEQISGKKIDHRTDIFSAGSILYQLLTGEQPFKGEGAWTVAKQIMQDYPPLPSKVGVSVAHVFDGIVSKALAKSPADRFANAKEFAAALRDALTEGLHAQAPVLAAPMQKVKPQPHATETELEFWRAIQNSADPAEFEFYVDQFPEGAYSQLARHKIAKLREPLEAARKQAEEKTRSEAEERARNEAQEHALREAEQEKKREIDRKARLDAEVVARREMVAKAQREAEESARREAGEKARREAQESAKRAAEAKARREADAKERRDAEERIRQTHAAARLKLQEEAATRAKVIDENAIVSIGAARPNAVPQEPLAKTKKLLTVPAFAAVALIAGGIGGYLLLGRTPAPDPIAESQSIQKAETLPAAPVVDVEKVRAETEERLRGELTDKAAVESVAMEKAVADKMATEKTRAEKFALARTIAEKGAAMKAAAEKSLAESAAAAKIATEKAIAKKAADEKLEMEKAAAKRAEEEKKAESTRLALAGSIVHYGVQRGDTLFAIARKFQYEGVTRNQMMVAIHRANRDAFPVGTINTYVGAIVAIPARETVAAVDATEANQQLKALLMGQ